MRHRRLHRRLALAAAAVLFAGTSAFAQTTEDNVVVLVNQNSPDSIAIGNAYQALRPGVTLLNIDVPVTETISIDTYQTQLLPQVQSYLGQGNNLANTHYLVTTKGVPYRIEGQNQFDSTPGDGVPDGLATSTFSSVESELTLAAVDLLRQNASVQTLSNSAGAVFNPYRASTTVDGNPNTPEFERGSTYAPVQRFDKYRRVNAASEVGSLILTSRLDGFTVDDVIASLNRAQNVTVPSGASFVLDRDLTFDPPIDNIVESRDGPDLLIRGLQQELEQRGVQPVLDTTAASITTAPNDVMAYVSLGTNGSFPGTPGDEFSYITEDLDFDMADGALFITYESFNATSFNLQADGTPNNQGGQGQVAEWIAIGGTAAAGHAFEPFARGVSNEEVVIPLLLDGFTFAEAIWLSNEFVSWQNVPIGDPLMTWDFEELRRSNNVPEPAVGLLVLGGLALRRRR
ncbi:MAG: hypothetical protein AAF656_06465 [Planctomycetota bacterium]